MMKLMSVTFFNPSGATLGATSMTLSIKCLIYKWLGYVFGSTHHHQKQERGSRREPLILFQMRGVESPKVVHKIAGSDFGRTRCARRASAMEGVSPFHPSPPNKKGAPVGSPLSCFRCGELNHRRWFTKSPGAILDARGAPEGRAPWRA